ncbi:o-succinylbenzoate--CoA ligase [Cytobacillus sp. FJAT-54145]|uniref:2-succinylbenzoate--CoA ligase n=1 Tax=Cytobacillus spartinae TaxID=3299023 RepID=A0ABW6KGK8_9BACI
MNETMPNFFKKRVFLTPERTAVVFENKAYTFKDLYDLTFDIAGRLSGKEIEKDQYLAVLLKNHVDTLVILLALQLLGVKAVILNNRLTTEELAWQINDSKVTAIITEAALSGTLENEVSIPLILKEELPSIPFKEPRIVEEIHLDDVCSVMYTSGTTGNPKGVLQTYGNHWWSAVGSALNLGLTEEDCWLCTMPLFHISGYSILMRSIIYGIKIVLHNGFDEQKVVEDVKKEKVSIMSVVTTMVPRILEVTGEEKLPFYFRCMLLGGGPAPLSVLERCVEKHVPVYQTYGMTETASQIVTLSPEYSLNKLGSAGKPLFPSQLKIIDSLGNDVGPNESGEIVVKGPNVTKGYLYKEEESNKNIQNGWLSTGDVGYLDEEGFLFVQDRRSDLIISGGENIYPAEIEGILTSHPSVLDAGVIGKADSKWGQIPVAFMVKKGEISQQELVQYCQQKLAKYKIPKEMYFIDEIPRNASKKLLRRKLREKLEESMESGR